MKKLDEYIGGMTWGWTGVRGTWANDTADRSMELMVKGLSVNWTAITFAAMQDHPQATEIRYKEKPTVSDEEILWAIRKAKSLGLKVVLKPVVNCSDGTWRAHINFFDVDVPCEPKCSEWFKSYNEFILHYARIAEETGCEMLCIGCEMVMADRREQEWRNLLTEVRMIYSGIITYNCDKYQEGNVTWWDAVDVISSSGYYPIDDWEQQLDRIEAIVTKYDKPFFFMESGCPSREGSEHIPNDWGLKGEPSEAVQADWYRAAFLASNKRAWVEGFMLWDWPAKLYEPEDAARNDDYCLYNKQAEVVVRDYYDKKTKSKQEVISPK